MARRQLDLELFPKVAKPKIPEAEKQACRVRQGGRCKKCGGKSTRRGLDVVRIDGAIVGLCRSDRLKWDAPERAAKAAGKRRRRPGKPRRGPARQLKLGER